MTEIIKCHPEAFEALKQQLGEAARGEMSPLVGGVRIETDASLPKHPVTWEWQHERFFEYEDSDREWCEFFGIGGGRREDTTKYVYYHIKVPPMRFQIFNPFPVVERDPIGARRPGSFLMPGA